MKKILRLLASLSTLVIGSMGLATLAQAQVCAVCTIAVASGLGISRLLGVDDTYTGVWLGAAVVALPSFVSSLIAKKWPKVKYLRKISLVTMIVVTLVALYLADGFYRAGALTHLAQGMIIGVICFLLGYYLDRALRVLKDDGGKPYFPFQKVVCPVCLVLVGTLGAWILVS
ncbi:hypothetical protein IJJ08_01400 [bacterium]|nr:hypothetical protein [bacterium]